MPRLLDGKAALSPLGEGRVEGLLNLSQHHCLRIPADIRPRAKVEPGFRDNLVSVLRSEGMDDRWGMVGGGWHRPGALEYLWPEPRSLSIFTTRNRVHA